MILALAAALALSPAHHDESGDGAHAAPAGEIARTAPAGEIARTAKKGAPAGVLRFSIVDGEDHAIPGRLTFVGDAGAGADLFPNTQAHPGELAVRKDVVYSLSGRGAITVPAGKYKVYASRGLEWSLAERDLSFEDGREVAWTAKLAHEVDTRGWISADFHLHTLTYSGHGDADLDERIISLVGEGVEFAVATDHDHNTDYGPTIDHLAAHALLTAITGNEVSTQIGHLNAFPLDPDRPVIDSRINDANALFKLVRAETNRFGIVPVIQLNHPRYRDIDWFGKNGLDPITGTSSSKSWSDDFDTLEVQNANAGSGYVDADLLTTEESQVHSVLADWFNLLNRGHRYGAVGNSDSHHVRFDFAGYPRNFVRSATDAPGEIDAKAVAAALRDKRMFPTTGPFLEFDVSGGAMGSPMGSSVAVKDGEIEVHVTVKAASWIDVDRVKIVVNGDVARELAVPDKRTPLRLDQKIPMHLDRDAWVVVLVEGDDSLAPVLADIERKHLPRCVSNPVWVDADGDGSWTSPWDQALAAVKNCDNEDEIKAVYGGNDAAGRALITLAAAQAKKPGATAIITKSLSSGDRKLILTGARAAEMLADGNLCSTLQSAWNGRARDGWTRLCLLHALRACGEKDLQARYVEALETIGAGRVELYREDVLDLFTGQFVARWMTIGPFPAADPKKELDRQLGPDGDADTAHEQAAAGGEKLRWRKVSAGEKTHGLVDLRAGAQDGTSFDKSIVYAQAWVKSTVPRTVGYVFGSDDAGRLWVDGKLVCKDDGDHAADLRHTGEFDLRAGWNRVLVKIENGGGACGFRLGVFDDGLDWDLAPH